MKSSWLFGVGTAIIPSLLCVVFLFALLVGAPNGASLAGVFGLLFAIALIISFEIYIASNIFSFGTTFFRRTISNGLAFTMGLLVSLVAPAIIVIGEPLQKTGSVVEALEIAILPILLLSFFIPIFGKSNAP